MPEDRIVVLTKSQAACLEALRAGRSSATDIATETKLSRYHVVRSLRALEVVRLAERGPYTVWRAASLADACSPSVMVRGRPRRDDETLSPKARRLLELLTAPIEGGKIAELLGVSRQGAHNIVHRLHAQGILKFGNPKHPFWMVMRTADDTPLLTREDERVLSATPGAYATHPSQLRNRTRLSDDQIEDALDRLVHAGLVEAVGEFNGDALYRATPAGLAHPQNRPEIREADPPTLPVYSDRVQAVLSAIENAGALRIRDVRESLRLPQQSINALMQYLKRRKLVRKTGQLFDDPYVLTPMGRITLAEMANPGHVQSGYEKGALDVVIPRNDDPRLSVREQRRVFRAIRNAQTADLAQVRGVTQLSDDQVETAVQGLVNDGLVEATGEFDGGPRYRATAASMPPRRRHQKVRTATQPRLYSERIQAVLSVISNAGALRSIEVSAALQLPAQSANALMQYLKGKALVEKTGGKLADPYRLTEAGRTALSGWEERRAA
jgi:DNA-binding IclR family transcriptional regulator